MDQIGQEEAQKLILKYCREFGLEEREGLVIEDVRIDFEETSKSSEVICTPTIDENRVLKVYLRDVSLLSGVRLFLARLTHDVDTTEDRPLFKEVFIGFFYPICILAASLILVFLYSPVDSIIRLVYGPILFTCFVLPIAIWMELRGRRISAKKLDNISKTLRKTELYVNENEIKNYAEVYLGNSIMNTLLLFAVYVVGISFLILAIITPST